MDANRYPYQEEAEYIQSLLENIEGTHIKVSIQQMDWGPCKEEMEAGNYNLCLKIQGLPSANPFSLFKGFMHTEGGTNISYGLGYHNDHVDELIEEAAACLDAGRLTEIYTELQEISAVDFPNIPVLYSQEVVASSSDITGYQATVYVRTVCENKPPRGGGLFSVCILSPKAVDHGNSQVHRPQAAGAHPGAAGHLPGGLPAGAHRPRRPGGRCAVPHRH